MRRFARFSAIAMATLVATCGVLIPNPASATSVALNMPLVTPVTTGSINRLSITVAAVFSDTELTRLTGNVLTTLDYDIVNGLPRFNTIEFTGGTINVLGATTNNVPFSLIVVNVNGTNIQGELDTQTIPSLVTEGSFATEDHLVRINHGTLAVTGAVTRNVDLAAEPIVLSQTGIGTVSIQQISVSGLNRTFEATVNLPVNSSDTVPVSDTLNATITAVGNVRARANFIVAFPLEGDYNRDDVVDAADYALWRDSLDQTGVGLRADGNTDLVVDSDDYNIWKSNFGSVPPGAGGSTAIPEPSAFLLCLAAFAACCVRCRLS